jgi:SulP family sulfate permease
VAATRGGLARFVPALSWVPGYQLSWLSKDAIAGFTIWGLLIPEGIAYASLAGLPPQAGLYTLLASLVLYPPGTRAAGGSSRPSSPPSAGRDLSPRLPGP